MCIMKRSFSIQVLVVGFLLGAGLISCSKDNSTDIKKGNLEILVTRVQGTIKDANGNPIAGVQVTDGVTIQETDAQGKYNFHVDSLSRFVYMSTPSGYMFPREAGVVSFYTKIRRRANLTDTIQIKDWTLSATPYNDENHIFIGFGDPQMKSYTDQQYFVECFVNQMNKSALSPQYPLLHIMTCGDLLSDKNSLNILWTQISQGINIPIFNTIGNHDHNESVASDDVKADDNYENSFGPTYYSYNRGKVHYIGLDDIFYEPQPNSVDPVQKSYQCPTVVPRILKWLKKDISMVPSDHVIFVAYHCPVTNTNGSLRTSASYMNPRAMLDTLLGSFTTRQIHLVAGHTHTVYNSFSISGYPSIKEHVIGATCGAWWRTERLCTDGAPNGYAVFQIKGTDVEWNYKAWYDTTAITTFAQQSSFSDFTTATGQVWQQTNSTTKSNCVVVDVWNWDSAWKVEWNNGGTWTNMTRATSASYDPVAYSAYLTYVNNPASTSYHMFYATPPTGARTFQYRVTDRFGNIETKTYNLTQAN